MRVTACIPSVRPETAVATLIAVCSQTAAPTRVVVRDASPAGLLSTPLLRGLTRWLGVEVHRAPPGENLAVTRRLLAEAADPGAVWFVDDDIVPWFDCLAQLLAARTRHGVPLVSGVKQDMVRHAMPDVQLGWVRCEDRRKGDRLVPCTAGDLFLVDRDVYLGADHTYRIDAATFAGGEDIAVSAQIASRHGAVVCPDAVGVHLRSTPSPWMAQGGHDRDRLLADVRGRLTTDEEREFLIRCGFPPEETSPPCSP